MNLLNELLELSGIQIQEQKKTSDATIPEVIEEGRNDPSKYLPLMKNTIDALKLALKHIEEADKYLVTDDFKYYKNRIAEIISSDGGEAGLENFYNVQMKKHPVKESADSNLAIDWQSSSPSAKAFLKKLGVDGKEILDASVETPDGEIWYFKVDGTRYRISDDQKKAIKESFFVESWKDLKYVQPPKGTPKDIVDMYNEIIKLETGPGLNSKQHEIYKKVQKAGYWISNVRGEMKLHAKDEDATGNKIKMKESVVTEAEKTKEPEVKVETNTDLLRDLPTDWLDAMKPDEKIEVPAKVKNKLKEKIADAEKKLAVYDKMNQGRSMDYTDDRIDGFKDVIDEMTKLLVLLDDNTVEGLKHVAIHLMGLPSPMMHQVPKEILNFITKGIPVSSSLRDYYNTVRAEDK